MKYLVDIDNTICLTIGSDYENSTPYEDRIKHFNALYEAENEIVYFTSRGKNSGLDWFVLTKEQLTKWGVLHTALLMEKPSYDILIDDKCINTNLYFT